MSYHMAIPPCDTTYIHAMVWQNQWDLLNVCLTITPTLVNFQDRFGNTPYHYAIMLSRENCINVINKYQPNVALCNNAGQTIASIEIGGQLKLLADMDWDVFCACNQCKH